MRLTSGEQKRFEVGINDIGVKGCPFTRLKDNMAHETDSIKDIIAIVQMGAALGVAQKLTPEKVAVADWGYFLMGKDAP